MRASDTAWSGRTGRIGYVAKVFPRLSETFILDEILALERNRVPTQIYSIDPAPHEAPVHSEALPFLHRIEVLSPRRPLGPGVAARELAACFRARPIRAAVYLARALVSRHPLLRLRRLREATHLAACLRRDRIAHVHAAWAHTPASVVRMTCRLTGVPWSMSAHAKDIHLNDPRGLAQKVATARFTVACTSAHRDVLAGLETLEPDGALGGKVSLVHHGVDAHYFARPETSGENGAAAVPLILSIGRLVPKKGFPVLLDAAARLARNGAQFRLEIIGGGPQRGELEDLVSSLGLRERVLMKGVGVREEIRAAYHRATCFVLACRIDENGDRDGIPNTLAEAMASGLPVVATRLPGIEEIVQEGVTGILVTPDDSTALAQALAGILADPERARAMGCRAREWIAEHFDARANGDRRAARLARALGIERVLYMSADRGVPLRGHKGASVHVRSVVAAFERAGVDTRTLTTRAGPAEGPALAGRFLEAREGVAVRALGRCLAWIPGGGPPFGRAVLRLLDSLRLYLLGCRLRATWKPDLVYERYALTAVAGAALASHLRVPLILEVNAPLAAEEGRFRGLRLGVLARWIERWLLRRAERVVVVSEALQEWALRQGVRRERILVLPNAADPEIFSHPEGAGAVRDRYELDGDFVIGFCGSLKPWHGVARLLEAGARAAAAVPRLRILIVGDGPERAALERRAADLGIADRVRFTGAVPHAAVPGHLAACDVLAAPYEPMEDFYFSPLKLAEYLQIGCPVLASAVGGIPQLAAGARQVTLIAPGDTDALAGAIESQARCAAAVSAEEPATCSTWTWDDVVRRVLEVGEQARRERWGWSSDPVPAESRTVESILVPSAAPGAAAVIEVNAAAGEGRT